MQLKLSHSREQEITIWSARRVPHKRLEMRLRHSSAFFRDAIGCHCAYVANESTCDIFIDTNIWSPNIIR